MCIMTNHFNSHYAKLANQGTAGIWVGFADGYPVGTYHVLITKTGNICLTKDVTFLNKSFGEQDIASIHKVEEYTKHAAMAILKSCMIQQRLPLIISLVVVK